MFYCSSHDLSLVSRRHIVNIKHDCTALTAYGFLCGHWGRNLEGLAEAGFLYYKVFISLPLGTVALCTRAEHPFRFLCIFANIFVLVVLVLFYFLGV